MTKTLSAHSQQLVQKLWNYCHVLRHEGVGYGDYVEQLTYLLFLKMAHERTQPPLSEPSRIPGEYDWPSLVSKDSVELKRHYVAILQRLSEEPGLLGLIFQDAQNKIQTPSMLKRLVKDLIDSETWTAVDADLKGDVYEGLLERNAADIKSGAGQYFTPRPLIQAIVDCVQPGPDQTIADPACGTGGFLLAAHDYITDPAHYQLDRDQKIFLRDRAFRGVELVVDTARLCTMNLFLHGIGGKDIEADSPIEVRDALLTAPTEHVDIVLANPPFGKKSAMTVVGDDGKAVDNDDHAYARSDFWATTSNKQLNFIQHIRSMLEIGGHAAVVVPDNVLFEDSVAGAKIRERLLHDCDLHTLLRLPTGIFYKPGVRANVIFFERCPASVDTPSTRELWVYDLRHRQHFTLKQKPLARHHLDDFVESYKPGRRHERTESQQFKRYRYGELAARPGFDLDIWADIEDHDENDPESLPAPGVLAEEIVEAVTAALEQFATVAAELNGVAGDEAATPIPYKG